MSETATIQGSELLKAGFCSKVWLYLQVIQFNNKNAIYSNETIDVKIKQILSVKESG